MHFGIVSPPVPGHLHPFGALGRELIARGHRVSLIHMPDLEERVRRESLEFIPIGHQDHPVGSLPKSLALLAEKKGNAALRFTIRAVAKTTAMMLREGPAAIRAAGIDMLLADQMEPAGCAIAEHLGIPFVTICNALALNREPGVPPPFSPWGYHPGWLAEARNRAGYWIGDRFTSAISNVVNRSRAEWGLKLHTSPEDSFSPLAQISQQPPLFDFPRLQLPPQFHYVGPLRRPQPGSVPFPWERLDGRPLIYASLGTLQNSRLPLFRCFAEACDGFDQQLVMTHGGGLSDAEVSSLPSAAVIVSYAPQLELLSRASLTLTHAGLNTVLDSLTYGVPAVAVPITYEQPAIAERLKYTGAGESIAMSRVNVDRLRELIQRVLLDDTKYARASMLAESIGQAGGVAKAAEIILSLK